MLRRRKRSTRPPRPAPTAPVAAPVVAPAATSRRRARPDAHVPQELVIQASDVILVTGFEPFGGERVNPSWDICMRLPRTIAGQRVETCRVPCEFERAVEVVASAIDRHRPSLVICLGQAGGRARIAVERVAINVDDARAPDNAGAQPIDSPIERGGPPAYFATLPVKAMVAAIRRAGVPAELSNSAGTYVCNHVMYGVLHHIAGIGLEARAGFVHVPYSEEQVAERVDVSGMSIASMVSGIEAAIRAACENRTDIAVSEGALS